MIINWSNLHMYAIALVAFYILALVLRWWFIHYGAFMFASDKDIGRVILKVVERKGRLLLQYRADRPVYIFEFMTSKYNETCSIKAVKGKCFPTIEVDGVEMNTLLGGAIYDKLQSMHLDNEMVRHNVEQAKKANDLRGLVERDG